MTGGSAGLQPMQQGKEPESFEGEMGLDGGDGGDFAGDELGVTAGGNDREAAHAEFGLQLADEFADQAAVAVHGAGKHGLACAPSDDGSGSPDGDPRQQGGLFVKVIRHGGKAGRDDPADVGAGGRDDVESDGRAEVDDDGRGAEVVMGGDGVGESILADGLGPGIIKGDAAEGGGGELKGRSTDELDDGGLGGRGGIGND